MQADSIKIESDEDGFHLIVEADGIAPLAIPNSDNYRYDFNIHSCAEALHEQVNLIIGGWLAEGERVQASMQRDREDVWASLCDYADDDPKHPDYHSVHADIWDARDKTLAATENMDVIRQALEEKA